MLDRERLNQAAKKLCRTRGLDPNLIIQAACPEIEGDTDIRMRETLVPEIRRTMEVLQAIEFAKGL